MDLANIVLANRRSVKTICTVSGSDSTHMVVTSPGKSKQPGRFFGGGENPGPGTLRVPFCHPSTFIELSNTALVKKRFVKTICMVSRNDSTHIVVTDPVNPKQPGRFFLGNHLIIFPGLGAPCLPSKHFF